MIAEQMLKNARTPLVANGGGMRSWGNRSCNLPQTRNNNTRYTPRIQTKPQLRMTACYKQGIF